MCLRQTSRSSGLLVQYVECQFYCTAELYFEVTDNALAFCMSQPTSHNWAQHIIVLSVYQYVDQ
jgi:predicted transposase YdaD